MTLSVATARAELAQRVPSAAAAAAVGVVTICGGGNGAHVAAAYLASNGVRVQVLTRQPERWAQTLELSTAGSSWEAKGVMSGRLSLVSKHAKHVIPQSDVVIVAAPANAHPAILEHVAPYLKKGVKLGALFAQGGFDWAAKKALGEEKLASVDLVRGNGVVGDCFVTDRLTCVVLCWYHAALRPAEHPVDLQGHGIRVSLSAEGCWLLSRVY
ncbi:unnamed protein product [Phytophthora lilii]|uniref:Unnamed protein product n=1 Tax=Phytophthora lilii TaxID=2077276 RepID=A0A9W6TWJ1_9STRA|nr:unnamed protein product [Phytophthora lilii]